MTVTRGQCDVRPMVTFPAARHHCPLAGTNLYCFLTEAHVESCLSVGVFVSEGPRVIAAQSVGMPAMLQQTPVLPQSPMTAGTPIILAPRIQTPQLTNVTSLHNQAVLAAGSHTPSVVSPANAATVPTSSLVYDTAYLQRMLEYPTTLDPSAIGKCLPGFIV